MIKKNKKTRTFKAGLRLNKKIADIISSLLMVTSSLLGRMIYIYCSAFFGMIGLKSVRGFLVQTDIYFHSCFAAENIS